MRYHPRFDSNAWVWPTGPLEEETNNGRVIPLIPPQMSGLPVILFDKVLTSATADPWFIVYADKRGGISAATFVIDDADKGIYAFYNTRLFDSWDMPSEKIDLRKLMDPVEGKFSTREATMSSVWNTLTSGTSPSYEGVQDLDALIRGETITYFASHFIPQSINKLYIGD